MPFAVRDGSLIAYETVSEIVPEPHQTIYAQLIAGWLCPKCGCVLRALCGPWSDAGVGWWEYDHRDRSDNSEHKVRPEKATRMPRYRGSFNAGGGYLYRFDHPRPLSSKYDSYDARHDRCALSVSMRVGVLGGIAALPSIPESVRERLVSALSSGEPLTNIGLIDDVTGQREPIITTSEEVAVQWRSLTAYKYGSDEKATAWDSILEVLLVQDSKHESTGEIPVVTLKQGALF